MVRDLVKRLVRNLGYEIRRVGPAEAERPKDLPEAFFAVYDRCRPYTMTSIERMYGLYEAVRYLEARGIEGDFVECGVWRGGSSMNMALTLLERRSVKRSLFLYDTYAGMSAPTGRDVDVSGTSAEATFEALSRKDHNEWCFAGLDEVRRNLSSTGYPDDRVRFIAGKVEETIPGTIPEKIALLRLDTDWYESTHHELKHLYPRLVPGGVLIIDDYGHWAGARQATDAYFSEHGVSPLLVRIDYTGRMMLKV